MTRSSRVWAVPVLAASAGPASAALPFTCTAKGDSWSVAGTLDHPADCTLACLLTDPQGDHDRVVCAAKLSGSSKAETLCDGFQVGRHWTSAEIVVGQCSYGQP